MSRTVVLTRTAAVLTGFVLIIALVSTDPARASTDDVREVTWQDLVPPPVEFDDPFAKLTEEQLYELSTVALMRELMIEKSDIMSEERQAKLKSLEAELTGSGIDIDYLLSQRERVQNARRLQAEAVVSGLDGETIRMPGYVLPLEFDGSNVTEFLLVPYVGACIHTPPPPANQIVHVKLEEGFISEGLFQAVWVTGKMSAAPTKKALYLVDGSSDISVGYGLQARSLEPYNN